PAESEEVRSVLHLLFSDQSGLTYIDEELHADSGSRLLIDNDIPYDTFQEYQRDQIDFLSELNVVESGEFVKIGDPGQYLALREIFARGALSYYHYSPDARAAVDAMVERGWLTFRSSLLTEAEADLFNYYLNQLVYSNGPDLRNKYLHGTQAVGADENEHYATYMTVIKLLICGLIKMNDDFALWQRE